MKTVRKQSKITSISVTKAVFYFLATIVIHTSYSQTNTLPANGNVGIGTLTPTNRLTVNGSARIDSSLTVKDSAVFEKQIRMKDKMFVEGDVVIKGKVTAKDNFKVNGNSHFKGNVVLQEYPPDQLHLV